MSVGVLEPGVCVEAVRITGRPSTSRGKTALMPVAARGQLHDLPDELWTKINIELYKDASDVVIRSLEE